MLESDVQTADRQSATGTTSPTDLIDNIERVIIGKRDVVTRAVTSLLAAGHILLEDVPGVGKTVLAKSIARSISGDFKRIQFTADLLPSDISGVNIYRQQDGEFTFRKGPLFTNVLLGDEINRATPRTQSSLLEAMEEMQCTVDGVRHPLVRPFFVIATQNPIELEGTYPLPFAQMDRFMVRLNIGYMSASEETRMLKTRITGSPLDTLQTMMDLEQLVAWQDQVLKVAVTDDLLAYIVAIVRSTRESEALEFGASPRGSLDMMRYAQATAFLAGRDYLLPDDVKAAAGPVLAHRVIIRKGTRHGTMNTELFIHELVEGVDVPV